MWFIRTHSGDKDPRHKFCDGDFLLLGSDQLGPVVVNGNHTRVVTRNYGFKSRQVHQVLDGPNDPRPTTPSINVEGVWFRGLSKNRSDVLRTGFPSKTYREREIDNSGATVAIDLVTIGPVRRLRFQRGADPIVYLTPADIDVVVWRIEAVRRDSDEKLTGLQLDFDLALLNPDATPYRGVSFQGETTIALSPQTIEL